jgi:CPA2 family monovalent cation:H+ antiporter-2
MEYIQQLLTMIDGYNLLGNLTNSHYQLLAMLAVGFVLATVFGYITQKIGLSPIVGYLIAGFFIGPFTPGFVANEAVANQLSEAGVILLMFGVGLHFKLDDLLSVKGVAITGAIVQSVASTIFGTFIGMHLGLSLGSSIILGLGLSVASTVVLIRVLTDNGVIGTPQGNVVVGLLIVEDIFTVLILVLLPTLSGILSVGNIDPAHGSAIFVILKNVGLAILRLALLWVIVMEIGGRFVPWIMAKIAKTRSQELFTLCVLVVAFTTAVGAAFVFEASFALGAFLGGMVVGKTKMSHQAGSDMLPLKDAFAVLFFLSVGMLLDPKFIFEYPRLIIACVAIILIIKPLFAILAVTLLGYSSKTSLTVGAGLAQIGEFSFILAQAAKGLELADDKVYNAIVISAIITITLNPMVFRQIPKLERFITSHDKIWKVLNYFAHKKQNAKQQLKNISFADDDKKKAIIVGFGPTGKSVTKALMANNITPIIIDTNIDTITALHNDNILAIYGDSSRHDVLVAAGIHKASYLIITVPSIAVAISTVSVASTINSSARILARARFIKNAEYLKQLGVSGIATEEEEVSRALTDLVLKDLQKQEKAQEALKTSEELDAPKQL